MLCRQPNAGSEGKPQVKMRETCFSATVHHDSPAKSPGLNPRFHSEKQLSKCMNSATTRHSLLPFVIGHNSVTEFWNHRLILGDVRLQYVECLQL